VTDLDVYQPAAIGQYQAGIVMTPENAKALDEQVRACTRAVLREGTDYGIIPGTGGTQTLWRPGAQKLLQWFRLGCTCDRMDTDTGDDGQRLGVTYRATVTRRLPDGTLEILATCEGYAGYDEDKFYQSAEQVQAKAEDRERMWAKKDRRVANPTKWQNLGEYRAPWNSVIKRAQKRAIVGATVDATAAGGLFSTEEEDDHAPVPQDDGPSWYEQGIEAALIFTDKDAGRQLYVDAAQAHRDGLITRRQQDHVQNTVTQRVKLLKNATPVDVEDLGRQAGQQAGGGRGEDGQGGQDRGMGADRVKPSGSQRTDPPGPGSALPPLPGEDEPDGPEHAADLEPGEAAEFGTERHRKVVGIVWAHLQRLGYPNEGKETDEDKAKRLADVARLASVSEIGSTNDLDLGELSTVADTLARCKNRAALDALLKAGEVDG
jgi:hypothetical protein